MEECNTIRDCIGDESDDSQFDFYKMMKQHQKHQVNIQLIILFKSIIMEQMKKHKINYFLCVFMTV